MDCSLFAPFENWPMSQTVSVFLRFVSWFMVISVTLMGGFSWRIMSRRMGTRNILNGIDWANSVLKIVVGVPLIAIGMIITARSCLSNMQVFNVPCVPCVPKDPCAPQC